MRKKRQAGLLPLENISGHRYELLKSWRQKGAYAFLLVSFTQHDEIYLLPVGLLERYWENAKNGGGKSIPYNNFVIDYELIQSEKGYVLHYLK